MLVAASSVDVERIQAATTGGGAVEVADYAGHHFNEVDNVAAVEGQVVELFGCDQVGTFAGVGLQLQLSAVRRDRNAV